MFIHFGISILRRIGGQPSPIFKENEACKMQGMLRSDYFKQWKDGLKLSAQILPQY
jgi:hypothetical protein